MPPDLTSFISPLLGALAGGIGVYVGIRSDIAHLKARVENAEKSSQGAHSRIDSILNRRAGD